MASQKGWKEDLGIYSTVSLTLVLGKIMDQIIMSALTEHVQNNQGNRLSQHGLMRDMFSFTNLISFYHQVSCLLDEEKAMGVVYLDVSKDFDTGSTAFS